MQNVDDKLPIRVSAPVYKLNFDDENPDIIAGMFLIADEKLDDHIKEFVDKDKLNDNTMLFFQPRHLIEIFGIIYGVLSSIGIKPEMIYKFIKNINKDIADGCFYLDYKSSIRSNLIPLCIPPDMLEKICFIFNEVIFIPYDKIDQLARMGVDLFKKMAKEVNKDE